MHLCSVSLNVDQKIYNFNVYSCWRAVGEGRSECPRETPRVSAWDASSPEISRCSGVLLSVRSWSSHLYSLILAAIDYCNALSAVRRTDWHRTETAAGLVLQATRWCDATPSFIGCQSSCGLQTSWQYWRTQDPYHVQTGLHSLLNYGKCLRPISALIHYPAASRTVHQNRFFFYRRAFHRNPFNGLYLAVFRLSPRVTPWMIIHRTRTDWIHCCSGVCRGRSMLGQGEHSSPSPSPDSLVASSRFKS